MCETIAFAHGATKADRDIWRPTRKRGIQEQPPEQMAAEFAKIEAFLKSGKPKQE